MYRERFALFLWKPFAASLILDLYFSVFLSMAIVHLPTSAIHSIDMHLLIHSFIQQISSYLMPAEHQSCSKHRGTKAKFLVLSIELVSREIHSMSGSNQHSEKLKSGEGNRDWQGSQEWSLWGGEHLSKKSGMEWDMGYLRDFQREGAAGAKPLRQEWTWCNQGTARKSERVYWAEISKWWQRVNWGGNFIGLEKTEFYFEWDNR